MLSKRLYLLFGTGAILVLIITAVILPREYSWVSFFMIPFVVGGALSFVFSPQLDWWWFQRNPPELPGSLGNLLLEYVPFYSNLSADNKTRFRQRTAMYLEARGFFAMTGGEDTDVPLDIKTIIAANAVMMTFGRKDFILDKFERIYFYLQAFPSPNHSYLHASELNEEDTCFLFSGEHIVLSFRQAERYYNIVLHELARAFELTYPKFDYPDFDEIIWKEWTKESVLTFMKMPEEDINLRGVSVCFFFLKPQKFKELMPQKFETYKDIFNINPLEKTDPVIDKSIIEGVP